MSIRKPLLSVVALAATLGAPAIGLAGDCVGGCTGDGRACFATARADALACRTACTGAPGDDAPACRAACRGSARAARHICRTDFAGCTAACAGGCATCGVDLAACAGGVA